MSDSQNCFAMRWSIRNFAMCTQKPGDMLQSPPFKEEPRGIQIWTFGVYPRGIDKENYVSIELCNKVKECDSFHFTVSIIGEDGTPQYSKEISTTNKNVTQRVRIPKFIKRSDLFHQEESLLPFRTLTLQCVIRKPFKLVQAYQIINSNIMSFVLNIRIFCDSQKSHPFTRFDTSPPIQFTGLEKAPKCVLGFCVDKLSPGESEVTVKLQKTSCYNARFSNYHGRSPRGLDEVSTESFMDCPLSLSIEIFADNDMKGIFFVGGEHVFPANTEDESFCLEPVRVNESSYRELGLLIDDTLPLLIRLSFSDGSLSPVHESDTMSTYFEPEPKVSLLQSPWEKIYKDRKYHDVVLKVGTESLPAHRDVLCIQSEVFTAMFDHDMTEKNTGIVNITDIDADVMRLLLKLFYTGKADNDLSCEDALNLYVAAQKYLVSFLQTVRSVLISKITAHNVWKVWRNTNRYQDDVLKAALKACISANTSKSLDLLTNDDFQALTSVPASNPEIDISDGQPFKKRRM